MSNLVKQILNYNIKEGHLSIISNYFNLYIDY